MFLQNQTAELWSQGAVRCVLVAHGQTVEVELRKRGRVTVPSQGRAKPSGRVE